MSVQTPGDPPSAGSGTSRSPETASHPAAPTPPRSRVGTHVLSLAAGVVLVPAGLAAFSGGYHGLASALATASTPSAAALAAVGIGVAILGIVALAAAGSAVGPLVGGAAFGVAPGLGFVFAPATLEDVTSGLAEPLRPLLGSGVRDGLLALGRSGNLFLLGLTLALLGVAAHVARRAGRGTERADAALRAGNGPAAPARRTPGGSPQGADPGPPSPPRSRRVAHIVTAAGSVFLTPVGLALVAAGAVALAARPAGEPATADALVWPWAVGAVALAAVVLAAGWSATGLVVAGTAFAVVPGALGLVSPDDADRGVGAALAWVGDLLHPDASAGLATATALGILLAWGATAALGGLGCYGARRDGARRERREIASAAGRS